LIERLREHKSAFSLHETTQSARPYLYAGLYRALRAPLFVVVPTPDVAERTFADLTYYVAGPDGADAEVTLVRPREESVGVIESPSERSARMTLFADLHARRNGIVVLPVAALRQFVMPRAVFAELCFTLSVGEEAGFEELQEQLYELG
jgi:transcription-repair coupling factor (superfamily II helicase)